MGSRPRRRARRSRSRLVAPHTPHFTDPKADLARPDASQISRPLPAPIGQVSQPTRAGEAGELGVQAAQARAALPQPPCCPSEMFEEQEEEWNPILDLFGNIDEAPYDCASRQLHGDEA